MGELAGIEETTHPALSRGAGTSAIASNSDSAFSPNSGIFFLPLLCWILAPDSSPVHNGLCGVFPVTHNSGKSGTKCGETPRFFRCNTEKAAFDFNRP
jgi:hypothetical protein